MNAPAKTTVEYWRELTEENQHGLARVEISQWVSEQAFHLDDGGRGFHEANALHRVLAAIETVAGELGSTPQGLLELRARKTRELLAFVGRHSPEAADAIRKSL